MITIQPYRDAHQAQVLQLVQSIQDEFAIPIALDDQPDLFNVPGVYQQGRGNFWVATVEERVVGTIALLDSSKSWGGLRKMFVHAAFRGKGIGCGQQLLQTLLDSARQQGLTAIYLGTTDRFKAAHRFYEKNGFVEISPAQLPEGFLRMDVDTKFYTYNLE